MMAMNDFTDPPASTINHPIFRSLDRLAMVMPDTEEALNNWRDRVGLTVLYSQVVSHDAIRLTHLDPRPERHAWCASRSHRKMKPRSPTTLTH